MSKESQATGPHWRKLLRALGIVALALVLLLLVAAGSLTAVLSTDNGTQWLLKRAQQQWPLFEYRAAHGSLTQGLSIADLQVNVGDIRVTVDAIDSRWQFWDLLLGSFTIDRLHLEGVTVALPPAQNAEPTPAGPWPSLTLPLPVEVANVHVEPLVIRQGETRHQIDEVQLAGKMGPTGLSLRNLYIKRADDSVALRGWLSGKFPYSMRLRAQWRLALADQPPFAGAGRVSGNLNKLTVEHQLSSPYEVTSKAQLELDLDPQQAAIDPTSARLEMKNQWSGVALPVAPGLPVLSQGSLHLSGAMADYRVVLRSQLSAPEAASQTTPHADPPAEKASEAGALPQLLATVLTQPAQLQIALQGQELKLRVDDSSLQTATGAVSLSGEANLNSLVQKGDAVLWNLRASLENLDLDALVPGWPAPFGGRMGAQLHSEGKWQGEQYQAEVTVSELQGEVDGQPLKGTAAVSLDQSGQHLRQLQLSLGENQLRATGHHGQMLRLDWQLRAPKLAQLYPQLSGSLHSRGQFSGSFSAPRVDAKLEARYLQFQDYRVDELNVAASMQGKDLALDVHGKGINAAILEDAELTAKASGSLAQHRFVAELHNGLQHLQLGLDGQWANGGWRGRLADLRLASPITGPWQLAEPAPLHISAAQVELRDFCLGQASGSLCAQLQWQDQRLESTATIRGVAVANFLQGLPAGSGISGELNGDFNASGSLDKLNASLSAELASLVLSYQADKDDPALKFPADLTLQAEVNDGAANAQARFQVEQVGGLTANARLSSLAPDAELAGELSGGFDHLQWLNALFPQLEKLDGSLRSNLQLGGHLAAPSMDGNLQLQNLTVNVVDAGLKLRDGSAALTLAEDGGWQIQAAVQSAGQPLALDGQGQLRGPNGPLGELRLTGNNFTAMDTEQIRLVISPAIDISLGEQAIDISGKLRVDDGHYHLKSLPAQAVEVSADEYIVSREKQTITTGRPLNVRVTLALNERFSFKGFGLSTRLGGNLRLEQLGDKPPQAYGSLKLFEGMYKAYGQKLAVDNGVLIFQGPLNNPGLNIVAERETDEATVGIRIGGFAQDIRSELYSDPALSPTDTMALLITGKLPSQMNEGEANRVMNAATALGISQSGGISNALRENFGLDVLRLEGGDTYTDSSLVVGKYLNPKLFVSYVQNLFTPAGAVQLEYKLSDSLGLKAQSGETQSIDLLYKIEHGD